MKTEYWYIVWQFCPQSIFKFERKCDFRQEKEAAFVLCNSSGNKLFVDFSFPRSGDAMNYRGRVCGVDNMGRYKINHLLLLIGERYLFIVFIWQWLLMCRCLAQ